MIYSPSKTEAYDFCALKGQLAYRDGWVSKEADNGLIGRIVGAAFAKGSEYVHRNLATSDAQDKAVELFNKQVAHYVEHGVSFSDLTKVTEQLHKAIAKYASDSPLTKWQLKGVELALPEYGRCRLDAVGIDPEGIWAIADLKYKRSLKLDYLNKTVNDYRDSWQFQHYPWAYNEWVAQHKDEYTPPYEPCQRMYLVLVVADPFKVLTFSFYTKPSLQKRWLLSAQQKWADIQALESGNRQPVMSATHRDQYGDCPFKRACLEMDLDEALMQFEYVKVPKMKED